MQKELLRDVGAALRGMQGRPGLSLVVVLSLGLGMAGVTLLFSVVNVLFLRPLPFGEADRVVRIRDVSRPPDGDPTLAGTSERAYFTLREGNQVFSHVATQDYGSFNLVGSKEPLRLEGAYVSANLLPTLGVTPHLGRNFTAEEDLPGGAQVVLLGYDVWRRQFGSDPQVLGRVVRLNDIAYTVIGVMPRGFQFPYEAEVWVPLQVTDTNPERLGNHYLFTVARLAPGVSLEQARQETSAVGARLAEAYPDEHGGWELLVNPIRQELTQDVQSRLLFALVGAAGFLLLIACANVGGMLLARGLEQERDLAVRTAVGASRRRLVQRLVVQGVVLALTGGVVGFLLTLVCQRPLVALSPLADMDASFQQVAPDWRVIGFVLAVSLAVGVLFSLPAALQVSRPDVRRLLNEQARGAASRASRRLLSGLVVAEVAVAVVLLIGAGLMVRSVRGLLDVDPGFDSGVLVAHLSLPDSQFPQDEQRVAFLRQVLEEVGGLPGAAEVAVTSTHPLDVARIATLTSFEGFPPADAGDITITNHRLVTPGFFSTMGISLLNGRVIDGRDVADGVPVVVLSRTLAEQHWSVEEAVGKRVKVGRYDNDRPWLTVVGVVEDVDDLGDFENTWYLPYTQTPFLTDDVTLVVRTGGDPLALAGAVRRQIWNLDAEQPVYGVTSNQAMMLDTYRQERFAALVLTLFAGLGLVLALVGIYGILSYSVVQRRLDIGVRMALGAGRGDVLAGVLRHGLLLTTGGLALGLAGALLLTRYLSRFLSQVDASDPVVFVAIAAGMLLVATAASLVPALRASQVEPVTVLRSE